MFYCLVIAFGFKQSKITREVWYDTERFKQFFILQVKQFMVEWFPNPAGEDRITLWRITGENKVNYI